MSRSPRGTEPASEELLDRVRAKGRSINIAFEGSDDLSLLECFGANANAGGADLTHLMLREDSKKIEVLEEFLHGTQQKWGIIKRLGYPGSEVHVKLFMIRHKRLLRLTEHDVGVLEKLLGND